MKYERYETADGVELFVTDLEDGRVELDVRAADDAQVVVPLEFLKELVGQLIINEFLRRQRAGEE